MRGVPVCHNRRVLHPDQTDDHDGQGALAQLGERYDGIVEVNGSIPLGSTTAKRRFRKEAPFSFDTFPLAGEVGLGRLAEPGEG